MAHAVRAVQRRGLKGLLKACSEALMDAVGRMLSGKILGDSTEDDDDCAYQVSHHGSKSWITI